MAGCRTLFSATAAAVLASGCGIDNIPSEVINGTAVATYNAPGTNFGAYRTYAIVNQIVVVDDPTGQSTSSFLPAPAILGAVNQNLAARGYVKVAEIDPANPPPTPPVADLAINVLALQGTNYVFYPCDFWGWWGYPGYGCDVSWNWIAYRTGTLLMVMSDLKNAPPPAADAKVKHLWAGAGYSVLTVSAASNTAIAVQAVNQAFAQSPYLRTP
jgi:hypothetical protein